jgi:hypothetical protein
MRSHLHWPGNGCCTSSGRCSSIRSSAIEYGSLELLPLLEATDMFGHVVMAVVVMVVVVIVVVHRLCGFSLPVVSYD